MELKEQLARTGADLIGMVTKSIIHNAALRVTVIRINV